jgi:2-octaprenyl-6-methoxyphenol hydroxylase
MEHPAFDGRAYAVAAGSRRLLEDAGVWDGLAEAACPILDIRVSDGRLGRPASPLFLHFEQRGGGEAAFGHMVEARSLRMALNARMHASPRCACWRRQSRGGSGATRALPCASPEVEHRCRLVVAAETRLAFRRAAGIPVTHLPADQTGRVCAISHEHPHYSTALEHFLPSGPFAQLPMCASPDALEGGAPNVSAIVWTERTAIARSMLALDDGRFADAIARRLGGHLGTLRVVGRRWSCAAALHAHAPGTRLVLVGDAAHTIHPSPAIRTASAMRWPGRPAGIRGVRGGEDGRAGPAAALPAATAAGHPLMLASTRSTGCSATTIRCCVWRAMPASPPCIAHPH